MTAGASGIQRETRTQIYTRSAFQLRLLVVDRFSAKWRRPGRSRTLPRFGFNKVFSPATFWTEMLTIVCFDSPVRIVCFSFSSYCALLREKSS